MGDTVDITFHTSSDVPVVWVGETTNGGINSLTVIGTQSNGFGTYSFFQWPSTTTRQYRYPSAMRTDEATDGFLVMWRRFASGGCSGHGSGNGCYVCGTTFVDGNTDAETDNVIGIFDDTHVDAYVASHDVIQRTSDGYPLAVWAHKDDVITVVNSLKTGLGTWTHSSAIESDNWQDFTKAQIVKLAGSGYGIVYQYETKSFDYSACFHYTTVATGMTGWSTRVDLYDYGYTGVADGTFIPLLGVDGDDYPFIARGTDLSGTITIYRNSATDGSGSWSLSTTVSLANCASGPTTEGRRAVILSDGTPAFLAMCPGDDVLYFVRSTVASAAGPWTSELIATEASSVDYFSLHMTTDDTPIATWISGDNVVHILATTLATSFS